MALFILCAETYRCQKYRLYWCNTGNPGATIMINTDPKQPRQYMIVLFSDNYVFLPNTLNKWLFKFLSHSN